jgi:hypothetical protein
MVTQMFLFLLLVALAAIGALEWFKALTKDVKLPSWLVPVLSGVICLIAGIAAVFGGMFAQFFAVTGVPGGILGGLVIGLIALAFVELAYQSLIQLVLTAVKWVISRLRVDPTMTDTTDAKNLEPPKDTP